MATLEEFCTIKATMTPRMLGNMPGGTRVDFPFQGEATSPHWEGFRPVVGVDHATIRGDGNMDLSIRATIGEKRETVAYKATGVSVVHSQTSASPQELITFETGNADLAWLNTVVGVGVGTGEGPSLELRIFVVRA